jgi:hypothetical protein
VSRGKLMTLCRTAGSHECVCALLAFHGPTSVGRAEKLPTEGAPCQNYTAYLKCSYQATYLKSRLKNRPTWI